MADDQNRFPSYYQNSYYATPNSGILGNTIEEKTRAILGWNGQPDPSTPPKKFSFDSSTDEQTNKIKKARRSSYTPYQFEFPAVAAASIKNRKWSCSSVSNEMAGLHLLTNGQSTEATPPTSPACGPPKMSPLGHHGAPGLPLPPPYCAMPSSSPISPTASFGSPLAHSSTPGSSPSTPTMATPVTTSSSVEIFERLRNQMPQVSSEQSKFRLLLRTVANVIELETKLAQLHEETRSLSHILDEKRRQHGIAKEFDQQPSPIADSSSDVPDDLQEIDVTAFRSLVCENMRTTPMDRPDYSNSVQTWQTYAPQDLLYTEHYIGQNMVYPLSNPLCVDIMS